MLQLAAGTYHAMAQMAGRLINEPVAELWPVPEGQAKESDCEWLPRRQSLKATC